MIEREIEIIKLLSDLGANPLKAGAATGPDAFLGYDAERLGLFTGLPIHQIEQPSKRSDYEQLISNAKYIDAIYKHLNISSEKILELLRFNKFPFVFSGDHSNGAATLAALKAHKPQSTLGVIWIDAHADLHTPYTTPSGNMHGMPVAMSLFADNVKNKKHELDNEGLHHWESIKNLGINGTGNIGFEDILFIDIRDLEPEEWDLIRTHNMPFFTNEDRIAKGISFIADQAVAFASQFDQVFVSFDIDSLDASLVPGTGTPVANGLSLDDAGFLLNRLYALENLSAIEITEINPTIERSITLASVYQVIKGMARVND